jgi:hypothetical protein
VAESRVIEVVHRPLDDHEVAPGIDVAGGAPGHLGQVVDVHVLADDHDGLGEHHQAHAPERGHDLARLAGVALADRDDHEIVEDSFRRHVDVHDLGQHKLDERDEQALGGLAEPVVLLRWAADDRRRIDGPRAPGEGREMKDRVVASQRIVARVVAERSLEAPLRRVDVAFEHDLGIGRHLDVDRAAADELDGASAQPAREDDLVHPGRQRRRRRVDHGRVAAEDDGHGHGRGEGLAPGMRRG